MLNCFLFEKFYLHYTLCDFDSILLHCTKLYILLSIDRELIFDVTFEPPPPLKNPAYATDYIYALGGINQAANFRGKNLNINHKAWNAVNSKADWIQFHSK